MSTITRESGELAYEHEGLLWKPVKGATSTFEEFIDARIRWMEIFHETQWNPWRKEELHPEAERACSVMHQWARAEPDHHMMTDEEVTAWMTEMRRESEARHRADDARWAREMERYSVEREKARRALLEREAIRLRLARELQSHRDETRFPGMSARARVKEVAKLESEIDQNDHAIDELSRVVGDPEEVVAADGRLPRDRRPLNLVGYSAHRQFDVEELQASIAAQRAKIQEAPDRSQKATLQREMRANEGKLAALVAVPRLGANDMCSECDAPLYQHHSSGDSDECRACPRWPIHTARMERVWENLRLAMERLKPPEPEPQKPTPLATLPGNLPIAEVIDRLSELQRELPDAVVKRGRANRWELWPGGA